MAVNLDSTFLMTHFTLPLINSGGRIINVASLAGRNGGHAGATAYAASKAALFGFTRGLSKELASSGITVLITDGHYSAATAVGPNAQTVLLNLQPDLPTVPQVLHASRPPFTLKSSRGSRPRKMLSHARFMQKSMSSCPKALNPNSLTGSGSMTLPKILHYAW